VYLVPIALGLALLVGAGLGYVVRMRGARAPWASLPLSIVVVNLCFLVAWINLLRGHRIEAWRREEWATLSERR
jgi:hypothetical protein